MNNASSKTNNIAPATTSFFNACRDEVSSPRDVVDKILPSSQPLAASTSVPSSSTNVDSSQTAGRGTETSAAHPATNECVGDPPAASGGPPQPDENNCQICRIYVGVEEEGMQCDQCNVWSHRECLFMTPEEYQVLMASPPEDQWFCVTCLSIRANKIKWGPAEGESAIKATISSIYEEIITWRKNLFMVPRGKAGTELIKELARIIRLFTIPTKWTRVALAMLHIFLPLMLQKPSKKSKAKDHTKYLQKRLKLWSEGDLQAIMAENREIQKRLMRGQDIKQESKNKNFCRLMLMGKVSQAMKFINNEDCTRGVHNLSDEIKQLLEEKHPKSRDACQGILLPRNATDPEPVVYEAINGQSVFKAAKQLQGSGGPTLVDSDGWKHILCSKSYGNVSTDLCEAIAELAKKLCRDDIQPSLLNEFVANRSHWIKERIKKGIQVFVQLALVKFSGG